MRYFTLAASAAFLSTVAAPAFAAEATPYVGVLVGWDHVSVSDPLGSASKDGATYGGVAGVDFKLAGAIVGAEVEGMGASTSENVALSSTQSASISAGRDLYVGARAGMVVAPHVLAYVKGGFTNAKVNGSYTSAGTTYNASTDLNGWRIGAGGELAMRGFRVRLEYRYSDYGQYNLFGYQTGVYTKRHQVVLGALLDL
jgi:outer membrane immunogenic protein